MSDATKAEVVAEAKRVAALAAANGREFDYSRVGVQGWKIRDVADRPFKSGELYVDKPGNDWKDFHSKFGMIWLAENGTLLRVDESYGESADSGKFDNSWFRDATNEELIGEGNLDYGALMKELRRLALIVE
jgi:hypothetical protein